MQINYSAAEPQAADRLLPTAKELGVAVLINRPFLAGEIFRRVKINPLPDAMKPFATTWGEALIKFCLANDACTCIIGATGNPDHMREDLRGGFGALPKRAACDALVAAVKQ